MAAPEVDLPSRFRCHSCEKPHPSLLLQTPACTVIFPVHPSPEAAPLTLVRRIGIQSVQGVFAVAHLRKLNPQIVFYVPKLPSNVGTSGSDRSKLHPTFMRCNVVLDVETAARCIASNHSFDALNIDLSRAPVP